MRCYLWFSTFLLCFLFAHSYAATPRLSNPVFQSLSTKNGLPQDIVNDIVVDGDGFVWIATDGGLARWDGVRTKVISGPDDSFVNAQINKITLEGDRALWISTYATGIYRFDFESQTATSELAIPYLLNDDWIQNAESFYWESDAELIIALPETVVRYNVKNKSYSKLFSLDQPFIATNHFIRYATIIDNILLLATSNGLFSVDLNAVNLSMKPVDYLNGIDADSDYKNVKFLLEDTQGRLWVSTVKGLFVTTVVDFLAQVQTQQPSAFSPVIANRNVWTMKQAQDDSFWLGTNKGLFELRLSSSGLWQSEHILEPHNGRTELSDKKISSVEIDTMGNLWLSSEYAGALYFGVKSAEIYMLQNGSDKDKSTLSDGVVWSLAQVDKASLWVGTQNGLNYVNLDTGESTHYLTSEDKSVGHGESLIEKIIPTGDGRFFLQTYQGVRLFDPANGDFSIPPLASSQFSGVFEAWNAGIAMGGDGYLYFLGTEFYRYSLEEQRIEPLKLDSSIFEIKFAVSFLGTSQYHNNRLFLAMGSGLWLIDPITFEHELVFRFSETQRSNDRSITSWLIDDNGVLWLAFNGYGLFGLDADTFEPLYKLNDNNLLISNVVYGLEKDENGEIWFSSHNGLHRYSPTSAQIQNYIYGRELAVSEFNQGASLRLQDGRLAYGSTTGVVIFSPEKLKNVIGNGSLLSKQTAITEVVLDNRDLALPLVNLSGKHIDLAHDDSGVTIYFSALAMSGVERIKYHFRLVRNGHVVIDGITEDKKLTLTSLEPGNYQFSVGPTVGSLDFTVLPAEITISKPYTPWRSPYAYAGYIAFLLCLIVAYLVSRQHQVRRLQNAQQQAVLFSDAFRQTRDWVIIFDKNKRPVAANPAFESVFGFNPKESLEKQLNRLYLRYPSLSRQLSGKLSSLSGGEFWKDEGIIEGIDGKQYDVLIDISAVSGSQNEYDHYLLVISDITEQKNAERKLLKIANYDNLTGLVNRSLLLDRLEHAIGQARQHEDRVAVMFVDLDRFKGINDSLGHDYGDKLLRVVANRMRNLVSDTGTVARLGGDEFVIVVEGVTDTDALTSFVNQIIESVETPISLASEVLRVSCSIGVAFYPDDGLEPAELIKQADVAMYSAKKDAMNGFTYFTKDMNERAIERLSAENLVKRAYSEGCFYNHYQPIVDAQKGQTIGVELLLRGEIDGNAIYPDVFIPILEQFKYIIEVTRIAMRATAEDLAKWYAEGFTGFVSINLSALHFKTEFDLEGVIGLLDEFNLPKTAFRFEITEGVLMDDSDNAFRQIQRFVDAGFILALDDFGTGYSSLSYLKRYPLSVLKIDKSFVNDMSPGSADDALVTTTIMLAANLNMHSVAEGVETKEQAQSLIAKGCRYHQGYYYARPMSADELTPYLFRQW